MTDSEVFAYVDHVMKLKYGAAQEIRVKWFKAGARRLLPPYRFYKPTARFLASKPADRSSDERKVVQATAARTARQDGYYVDLKTGWFYVGDSVLAVRELMTGVERLIKAK